MGWLIISQKSLISKFVFFFCINKLKMFFLLVFCLINIEVCGLVDYLLEIADLNF